MTTMRRREKGDGYLARKARADGRWRASYVGSDGRRHYLHGATKAEAREKLAAALRDKAAGLHVAGPSQTVAEFLDAWLRHKRPNVAPRTAERYAGLIAQHIVPAIGHLQLRRLMPQHIADLYLSLARGETDAKAQPQVGTVQGRGGSADSPAARSDMPMRGRSRDRHPNGVLMARGASGLRAAGRGSRAGLSPSTIGQVHAILHGSLDQAVRWHAIARNPAAAVKAPRPVRREMRFLDTSQVRTMLAAAAGDPLEPLYVTAVYSGLRLGELLGLRWSDVDLDARQLTVRHTLTREDGAWILRQPKTVHSRRTIHLAPIAADTLRAHYLAEAQRLLAMGHRVTPTALVFSDRWGDPVNPWHVTERAFKPLLRRAGLPTIRFHDLRHTFASMMLSEGARVDVVSKMLGHASPAVTLGVYAHLMPGDEEAAVARLQARLGGGA